MFTIYYIRLCLCLVFGTKPRYLKLMLPEFVILYFQLFFEANIFQDLEMS